MMDIKNKTQVIYIVAGIIIAVLLFSFGYFLGLKGKGALEKPETVSLEQAGAGEVGEVMVKDEATGEESPLVSAIMPPVISGTSGKVLEVKTDSIIIRGSGSNFADGLPRNIQAAFTTDTIVFSKNQTFRWTGLSGLKHVETGMEVLLEAFGNIRGKTEFQVKIINIL